MIVSMMMMMTFETTHFTKGKSDSKCGNILTPYFTEYTLSIKKCSHCLETLLPTMHFMIITIAVVRHYNNGRRRQQCCLHMINAKIEYYSFTFGRQLLCLRRRWRPVFYWYKLGLCYVGGLGNRWLARQEMRCYIEFWA